MTVEESGPVLHKRLSMPLTEATVRYERAADIGGATWDQLIELLRRSFDGGPNWFRIGVKPVDHLKWKAVERPEGAIVELTELGEALVGMRLEGMTRFFVHGRSTLARHGSDAAIDPEHQGMGISSARTRFRESLGELAGVEFAYSVGTHPASPLMRREASSAIIIANHIETFARPLNLRRLIEARRERRARPPSSSGGTPRGDERSGRAPMTAQSRALRGLRYARALTSGRPARQREWAIRTVDHFDHRVDELATDAFADFDLALARDAIYLNWRFRDPRGGRFVVRVVEEGGQLLGYSALRLTGTQGVLADLLVRPGQDDVLRALLRDASWCAATRGLADIRAWLPRHHPYRAALEAEGYATYPNDYRIAMTPINPASDIATLAGDSTAKLHFMVSDTDYA